MPHTVGLQTYLGSGAYGDVWGDEETVPRCLVEDTTQNVVDSAGQTVVSGTVVYMEPRPVPVGSLVTVWPGTELERESRVVSISRWDHPSGLSHQALYLK